jgi:hypothetical protein
MASGIVPKSAREYEENKHLIHLDENKQLIERELGRSGRQYGVGNLSVE